MNIKELKNLIDEFSDEYGDELDVVIDIKGIYYSEGDNNLKFYVSETTDSDGNVNGMCISDYDMGEE